MRAGTPQILVGGILLMLLGAIYAVGARYIRDLTVRTMQRESYVTAVRVFGIGMLLAGAGVLVALGLDLL